MTLMAPMYGVPRGYEPETGALFARFTSPPDAARTRLINDLIVALKAAGVWSKLDAFYVMAAHDSQAARRNWIVDQYNLTAVASPTFTTDRGYTGNGSSSYLDTGFNPATAGGLHQQNDAHVSSYALNNVASDTAIDLGQSTAPSTYIRPRRAGSDVARLQLNQSSFSDFALSSVTSAGQTLINRLSSAGIRTFRDGSLLGTATVASTSLPNTTISLLRGNSGNYSTRQIACASVGAGLSDGEVAAFHAALNTYLVAVGAA